MPSSKAMAAAHPNQTKQAGYAALVAGTLLSISPSALAHVSEQGFVLLLPTQVYTAAGIAVVVATLVALATLPQRAALVLFRAKRWRSMLTGRRFSILISLFATAVLLALIALGWFGPRDPLKNLLPLTIWTLWWIGIVSLQGVFGNVWHWLNPWHGIAFFLSGDNSNVATPTRVSDEHTQAWPALILFVGFYALMLADIAPDDPARLASIVGGYFIVSLIGIKFFGAYRWFQEFDFTALVFRLYGYLAPLSQSSKQTDQSGFGLPGWALLESPKPSLSVSIFALIMLGCGSFDGINETFWWLGIIGVNPLDFQGRSSIVWPTLIGMFSANLLLVGVFAACVYLGLVLAKRQRPHTTVSFINLFCHLSLCLLPIAFAYHVSHFIASFLVNVQYSIAAISDPLNRGSDWLGLGQHYVTTGFLNNHHTVEILWLTQAGIVVFGHVLSILLSHGIAVRLFQHHRAAVSSQIPLAAFMVAYTFLGLWLLASPRGA